MFKFFGSRALTECHRGRGEGIDEPRAGDALSDMVGVEAVGAVEEVLGVHMRLHAFVWESEGELEEGWQCDDSRWMSEALTNGSHIVVLEETPHPLSLSSYLDTMSKQNETHRILQAHRVLQTACIGAIVR
jgi:hypothetical protein